MNLPAVVGSSYQTALGKAPGAPRRAPDNYVHSNVVESGLAPHNTPRQYIGSEAQGGYRGRLAAPSNRLRASDLMTV